jgi:hypothetical protein
MRVAALAGVLGSGLALANLRAPIVVERSGSAALRLRAGDVVVLGEKLQFDCSHNCKVEATYRVRAAAAGHYRFAFILPVEKPVTVQAGTDSIDAKVASAAPERGDERGTDLPRFEADFEATLPAGESPIVISYEQPTGAHEHDYGYFKKGRFVDDWHYFVAPLKEWRMDSGFALDLEVSVPRPAPGFFARHFSTLTSLKCEGRIRETSAALPGAPVQEGERLVYRARLKPAELPDLLECRLGDEDLL